MAIQKIKTSFLGVRFREHATRKHGVRLDRCFFVRFKVDGKDREEMAGWASEGMSAEKAFNLLSVVRENIRSGQGPQSLAEMREANEEKDKQAKKKAQEAAKTAITLIEFWEAEYLPSAEATKKPATVNAERFLFKKWICPTLGEVTLQKITMQKVEHIAVHMQKQGMSAASVRYALAVISQIWNQAAAHDLVQGDNPTKRVKKPRADNRRMRFLTKEEARELLNALKVRSIDTHDAAMLSLFTGLRAGEIHALTWADVDMSAGTLYVKDPKNKYNRHAYMTQEVKEMLQGRFTNQPKTAFVFPAKGGGRRFYVPNAFEHVVKELGLNSTGELDAEGNQLEITDARQRVVFHSLRHTFASWLAQAGTPIFTLAQLMGHHDLKMTQRYAHLAPDNMQAATMSLQGALSEKRGAILPFNANGGAQ